MNTRFDFSGYIQERTQNFTGREWAFDRINTWLSDQNRVRRFLITGAPGSGKTALAARLAQFSEGGATTYYYALAKDFLAFYHFCQYDNPATLEPLRFVEALSETLAARFTEFKLALENVRSQYSNVTLKQTSEVDIKKVMPGARVNINSVYVSVGNVSPSMAFNVVVSLPLEEMYSQGFNQQIVLLVDSIHEARNEDNRNPLAQLLRSAVLPRGVRLILTSRPDDLIASQFGDRDLDLVDDAPADRNDVRQYAWARLDMVADHQRSQFAARLAEAANGNFLYTRYVLDDLLPRIEKISALDTLQLPDDLEDQYRKFIEREVAGSWQKDYAPVLGMVTVGLGDGLTLAQIAAAAGRYESDTGAMRAVFDPYLAGSKPDGPFRIYHQSFRDFLLKDKKYPIYPGEMHSRLSDSLMERCQDDWVTFRNRFAGQEEDEALQLEIYADRYALRNLPSHLAEAARLDNITRRPDHTERLVRLVMDPLYRQARLDEVNTLPRDLERGLKTAAMNTGPAALPLLIEIALEVVNFHRERLKPEEVYTLARQGNITAAEERLRLIAREYNVDRSWQLAALLVASWSGAEVNSSDAAELRQRVTQEAKLLGNAGLDLLVRRIEDDLQGIPTTGLFLTTGKSQQEMIEILGRLGGSASPTGIEPVSSSVDDIVVYLADTDGPVLVGYASEKPEVNSQYFDDYLELHAANEYRFYRNRSLAALMTAVLNFPDPAWIKPRLERLAIAAHTGSRVDFREMLPLAVLGLEAKDQPAARQNLDGICDRWQKLSMELSPERGAGDSWGFYQRRLVALAEIYQTIDPQAPASQPPAAVAAKKTAVDALLEQAGMIPRAFAGFRATSSLALAEARRLCQPQDTQKVRSALQEALSAAHNIQDPNFCATVTARVNAMRLRWWPAKYEDLDAIAAARELADDPDSARFAAVHRPGESFGLRSTDSNKVVIPDSLRQAMGFAALAQVYDRLTADLNRLNPEINLPDPEMPPLVAGRLSAELLARRDLPASERIKRLQEIVPVAARDPKILDTVLARLLLLAQPQGAALQAVAQITSRYLPPAGSGDNPVPIQGMPA